MTLWIGLLFGVCLLAALAFTSWRRRVQSAELGTVTTQWLIEHRGYDRHYSER